MTEGTGKREQTTEEAARGDAAGQEYFKGSVGGKLPIPTRCRQAVEHIQEKKGVPQRQACQVFSQPRSSHRYQAKDVTQEEKNLVTPIYELVRKYPRYGYLFTTVKLRQEGWQVNFKRIYLLWRRESLEVSKKTRKKRRLGHSGNSCVRRQSEHRDHVWT